MEPSKIQLSSLRCAELLWTLSHSLFFSAIQSLMSSSLFPTTSLVACQRREKKRAETAVELSVMRCGGGESTSVDWLFSNFNEFSRLLSPTAHVDVMTLHRWSNIVDTFHLIYGAFWAGLRSPRWCSDMRWIKEENRIIVLDDDFPLKRESKWKIFDCCYSSPMLFYDAKCHIEEKSA